MPQGKSQAQMMADALRLVMEQGGAAGPKATPTQTPQAKGAMPALSPELLAAFVRLHGSGAKMSPWRPEYAALSVDDQAMAMRPRAKNYGKDILLKGGK